MTLSLFALTASARHHLEFLLHLAERSAVSDTLFAAPPLARASEGYYAMPPKKKDEPEEAVGAARFGRVRNNLKMGVVGLPNVGKSSLFNLLNLLE